MPGSELIMNKCIAILSELANRFAFLFKKKSGSYHGNHMIGSIENNTFSILDLVKTSEQNDLCILRST